MVKQTLFFDIEERRANYDPRVRVSAGTVETWPGGRSSSGDILISLDLERSTANRKVGMLQFPERAELTFDGSMAQMRALWMQFGNCYPFLNDSRFALLVGG